MKKNWTSSDITDQQGKLALVTGSNTGIGFETAKALAQKNATVIMACRSLDKANRAADQIKATYPTAIIDVMALDLSSLDSIKQFTEAFKAKYDALHLMINNAGVMMPPYSKTKEGFELQIGTNHLGHFYLNALLFDLIAKTPQARIVSVSSMAHNMGKIDFDDINWEKRKYSKGASYGDSKIANLYYTYYLQNLIKEKGLSITVAAAHPGWTATDLQRNSGLASFLNIFFAQARHKGAWPTLYAATGEDVESGDYYGPGGFMEFGGYPKKVNSNPLSHDRAKARQLWELSEKLTGITFKVG